MQMTKHNAYPLSKQYFQRFHYPRGTLPALKQVARVCPAILYFNGPLYRRQLGPTKASVPIPSRNKGTLNQLAHRAQRPSLSGYNGRWPNRATFVPSDCFGN